MDTNIQTKHLLSDEPHAPTKIMWVLRFLILLGLFIVSVTIGKFSQKHFIEVSPSPTPLVVAPTLTQMQPTPQQARKACSHSSECGTSRCVDNYCVSTNQNNEPVVTCPVPPDCSDIIPDGCIRKPPIYNVNGCFTSCGQLQCGQ